MRANAASFDCLAGMRRHSLGSTYRSRGGLYAEEAIELLRTFYSSGNPAGVTSTSVRWSLQSTTTAQSLLRSWLAAERTCLLTMRSCVVQPQSHIGICGGQSWAQQSSSAEAPLPAALDGCIEMILAAGSTLYFRERCVGVQRINPGETMLPRRTLHNHQPPTPNSCGLTCSQKSLFSCSDKDDYSLDVAFMVARNDCSLKASSSGNLGTTCPAAAHKLQSCLQVSNSTSILVRRSQPIDWELLHVHSTRRQHVLKSETQVRNPPPGCRSRWGAVKQVASLSLAIFMVSLWPTMCMLGSVIGSVKAGRSSSARAWNPARMMTNFKAGVPCSRSAIGK